MSGFRLDHLAIAAETLEAGVRFAEDRLGVRLAPGGVHPAMGTHNRLLSLGPDLYLEVIAVNPEADPPGRARWFGLDGFSGAPRLAAWILACDDLAAAKAASPVDIGEVLHLSRGDLRWQMAVPDDGRLPFDGLHPAVICWQDTVPPPARLPASGVTLEEMTVRHPEAAALSAALAGFDDRRVRIAEGAPALSARFMTPGGEARL